MCESRSVYRQMFDAQVLLSQSLLAGRQDTRTQCVSAEDSKTHCSTTSRIPQQVDDDDVSRLPDTVVLDGPPSDIVERLMKKKEGKHEDALKSLKEDLSVLSPVCEQEVRTVCQQLLTSLQDTNHKLETLKAKMKQLEDHDMEQLDSLWLQVEEEVKQKKLRVVELRVQLGDCERRRTEQIAHVLRRCCPLLVEIGALHQSDVHRLMHSEATMLNQALLANRRSMAHLLLRLQEENLQEAVQLRDLWEESLHRWRGSRVAVQVERIRSLCRSKQQHHLLTAQHSASMQQRCDIIRSISSLVPPTCSTALVSDWFDQLTGINQQIDHLHTEHLHLLHSAYEQAWQELLEEAELAKVALLVLQLPDEEVSDITRCQLLPLVRQRQREDQERLAALNARSHSAAQQAAHLSRCVLAVLRGLALLWETHDCRLKRREEELQRDLEELRHSQHQHTQKQEEQVEELMEELRQQSTEDALRAGLQQAANLLQDIQHTHTRCVSEQSQLLARLPSLLMDELLTYSSSICSFFHLSHAYRPSVEGLQELQLSLSISFSQDSGDALLEPISSQKDTSPAHNAQDWLMEADSALKGLYDFSIEETVTTSGGVVYSGPTFRSPTHNQPDNDLSLFPEEVLTNTLSRFRLQSLEKLEQHFLFILNSAVTMVTERTGAVQLEEQLHLQNLDLQHIKTHVYQPRLEELRVHQQCVEIYHQQVMNVFTSCRMELKHLQSFIGSKNQTLMSTVCELEHGVHMASSSRRVQVLSVALKENVAQHARDTQCCEMAFRRSVGTRLEELRGRSRELLDTFRLFSEGGDCSPAELKQLHRRLQEDNRLMEDDEENIYFELEVFMSQALQEVKETTARLQERLLLLESEVTFTEKAQEMLRSASILITAEVARSNQQERDISRRLEGLRRSLQATQVSAAQAVSLVSSLVSDLNRRCQYLEFNLQRAAMVDPLQPSSNSIDVTEDSVVDVLWSLSRVGLDQRPAQRDAGSSTVPHQQRVPKSVRTQSVKAISRSIRMNWRFQIWGSSPGSPCCSFRSVLNTLLWNTNDSLLQAGEDFYHHERCSLLQLLPDTVDQWAESMQQSLRGYQENARKCMSSSRAELGKQLSSLDGLLRSLPSVLMGNHERRWEAELRETMGGVRQRLEEAMSASEREKAELLRLLRPTLSTDDVHTLNSREQCRQQQLNDATCSAHLELQECLSSQEEEFMKSLSTLTEQLLTCMRQVAQVSSPDPQLDAVSMETTTGSLLSYGGIGPASSVTTATITDTKLSLKVQEEKEAAMKRFQQLIHAELLISQKNKQRQLNEQESWNAHWRKQIHNLNTQQ